LESKKNSDFLVISLTDSYIMPIKLKKV